MEGVNITMRERLNHEDDLKRLDELSSLDENWDDRGGHPSSKTAISEAIKLLQDVRYQSVIGASFATEEITHVLMPIPSGGVTLEWSKGIRKLGIDIGPNGEFSYLLVEGEVAKTYQEEDGLSYERTLALVLGFNRLNI